MLGDIPDKFPEVCSIFDPESTCLENSKYHRTDDRKL
jgi:hypothetical protein